MSTVFTVLIVLCASISSLTPSLSKKLTNSGKPWYKKFTKTGLLTVFSTIMTIILTISQFLYNESESKRKEEKANIAQNKRDIAQREIYNKSLLEMKRSFDESNVKIVSAVTKTLGKYGYKLDSANNRLVKVIEKSPNDRIVSLNFPTLKLSTDNAVTKVDSSALRKTYKIAIQSYNAGSTNFKVRLDLVAIDKNDKNQFPSSLNVFYPNERMFTNEIKYANVSFFGPTPIKGFYIYVHGNYTDLTGKNKYIIDDLYRYSISKKEIILPNQTDRYDIIKFITLSRLKKG